MNIQNEDQDDEHHGLDVNYGVETLVYYQNDGTPWPVQIIVGLSTRGRNLIQSDHVDSTGVLLWPASHLMCQYLVQHRPLLGSVLELGCGCGLVSAVAAMTTNSTTTIVATDRDYHTLRLCEENMKQNPLVLVKQFSWGDECVMDELLALTPSAGFDVILGADIVYPDTTDHVLDLLFISVRQLLSWQGHLLLSFVSRDGTRTPQRFLSACQRHFMHLELVLEADSLTKKFPLPPMMGAKLLKLIPSETPDLNLGSDTCPVFPGLHSRISSLNDASASSDDEWQPPFSNDTLD